MSKLIYLMGILPAIVTALVLNVCPPADAQTMRKIQIDSKDGMAQLPEVGAIIIMEDGQCKVMVVSPAERRPAAYKSVDLKEGDVVAMANGKRVTKPLELDSLYKAAKIGDVIKLGIKRGEDMMIIAFAKADEKDLPKRQMKMVGGPEGEGKDSNIVMHKMDTQGAEGVTPLPSASIVIGDRKGKVVIVGQIGMPDADPRTKEFKTDDVLISIDGQPVTSPSSADEMLSKIADGQEVRAVVEREGKQITITFTKRASNAVIKFNRG